MPRFSADDLLRLAAVAQPPPGPKVAISGMQKSPPDFIDWIYFHLSVGIWGFLLRIEDPDQEFSDLLRKLSDALGPRFQAMPENTAANAGGLHDVMQRAGAFVTQEALPKARELGLDYVLWIDADELIFPVSDSVISTAFAAASSYRQRGVNPWANGRQRDELAYVSFVNYEARFPHPHCEEQPFTTEGTRFQTNPRFFELYTEGKPAANVRNVHAAAINPHAFSGGDFASVPPSLAVVLHFDSPGFKPWWTKWSHHAKGQSLADGKPGDTVCVGKFPYYRESLEVLMRPSSTDEQLEVYSKYRCLPTSTDQAASLKDFDIAAKIQSGQLIVAPSLVYDAASMVDSASNFQRAPRQPVGTSQPPPRRVAKVLAVAEGGPNQSRAVQPIPTSVTPVSLAPYSRCEPTATLGVVGAADRLHMRQPPFTNSLPLAGPAVLIPSQLRPTQQVSRTFQARLAQPPKAFA